MLLILDATYESGLLCGTPAPMLPLLDRPFLQHVVESAVDRGVTRIAFLISPGATETALHFGDGARWGVTAAYHETAAPLLTAAELAEQLGDGPLLLGRGVSLPCLPAIDGTASSLFLDADCQPPSWTGWALLTASELSRFGRELASGAGWRPAARAASLTVRTAVNPVLSAATGRDLVAANRLALHGRAPHLYCAAKETDPGIRMARGARVHPTARLQPPVFLGEGSYVGRDCEIGPCAVLSSETVIEHSCTVVNSVVLSDTYIGPGLAIRDSIVNRGSVHNLRLGVELELSEPHIAGALRPPRFSGLRRLVDSFGGKRA